MIVAIPLDDGKLCPHFGHCGQFALIQVDEATKTIMGRRDVDAPPHEPGLLPAWLAERGVGLVICGGMGPRAMELFVQKAIKVVIGAADHSPEKLVAAYLAGTMESGNNICHH
jgi:predicted Fe-Mo cluster-binding NifX family protein